MCIFDRDKIYVVPRIRITKSNANVLSATQSKKGLRRYKEKVGVLKEYKYVMPKELPRKLPPKRKVDNPKTKPLAMSPTT